MTQDVNTAKSDQPVQWTKGQLDQLLLRLLGSKDLVHAWWNTENMAFNYMMPKDVYYQDPFGRQEVSDYIYTYADGEYK